MKNAIAWVGIYEDPRTGYRIDVTIENSVFNELGADRYTLQLIDGNGFKLAADRFGTPFHDTPDEKGRTASFALKNVAGASVIKNAWPDGFRKTALQDHFMTSGQFVGFLPKTLDPVIERPRGESKDDQPFIRVVAADAKKLAERARVLRARSVNGMFAAADVDSFLKLMGCSA